LWNARRKTGKGTRRPKKTLRRGEKRDTLDGKKLVATRGNQIEKTQKLRKTPEYRNLAPGDKGTGGEGGAF